MQTTLNCVSKAFRSKELHLLELFGSQKARQHVHELKPQVLLRQRCDLSEHAERRLLYRQQHICMCTDKHVV